jgi:hypothetical protein
MGFITVTLNLILTAGFTGIGVSLGNALYEIYIKKHILKLDKNKGDIKNGDSV